MDNGVSVYSELLRRALQEKVADGRPLPDLVSEVVALRPTAGVWGDVAARLGDQLAYDVALVQLCDRLGVAHALTGDLAGPLARRQAEIEIMGLLPSLGDFNNDQEER